MQLGELVKRHCRQRMMLRMKGHVPRYQPHQPRRESRARVLEHVFDMGAGRVFGEEKESKERLAEECWHNPRPNQNDDPQRTDAVAKKI